MKSLLGPPTMWFFPCPPLIVVVTFRGIEFSSLMSSPPSLP
jgi:hypothetical protein